MHNLSRHHIKYVLGIEVPLNESISIPQDKLPLIVEQQLLYEGFIDTLKSFAGNVTDSFLKGFKDFKDFASTLYTVIKDGLSTNFANSLIRTFEKSEIKKTIDAVLQKIQKGELLNDILQKIKNISNPIGKLIASIGFSVVAKFFYDKFKSVDLSKDSIKQEVLKYLQSYLSDAAIETLSGFVTGGFSSLKSWLEKIGIGIATIYNTLKSTIDAFKDAFEKIKSGGNPMLAKLVREECCSRSISLNETANRLLLSEGMIYHLDNKIDLNESIYRPQSSKFLELFEEARVLYENNKLQLSEQDEWYFNNTDLGKWGMYEGVRVPLDFPMTLEFLMEVKSKSKKKQPELNKPKRGGPKKFYVYVRKPGGGIKKLTFGDTTGLSAKINNPEARKSFAARHKCSQAKDKTTPKYWSCRLPRYASLLGLKSNFTGFW